MAKKVCKICNEEKDLDSFHKSKKHINGVQNHCKDCSRIYQLSLKYKDDPKMLLYVSERPKLKSEGKRRCMKCETVYPVDKFPGRERGWVCLHCQKKNELERERATSEHRNSVRRKRRKKNFLKTMLENARDRSNRNNLNFDLDIKFLEELYESQNKKCSITGLDFVVGASRHPYTPSIDKIDPSKGYVKTNVRIVLLVVNVALLDYGLNTLIEISKSISGRYN